MFVYAKKTKYKPLIATKSRLLVTMNLKAAKFLFTAILLLGLNACDKQAPPVYQQQILALGTLIDISLYDVNQQTADKAIAAITKEMEKIHHDWHTWQPSKLTTINQQLARGESATLDEESQQLLQTGIDLARQSGDLFNPAAGKMVALWGFHSDEQPNTQPPSDAAIQTLVNQNTRMSQLKIENNQLTSPSPELLIDVGGFAKGYAIDKAITLLRQQGINNAIINAGGDLRAIGQKGEWPWRIGIRHPRQPGVIASLTTQADESVFTSGDYERYFDYQGMRYHHIIDPRSGRPARGTRSVTVVHHDATTADAAATALFIAGPSEWRELARKMKIDLVMLIDEQGVIQLTKAMAERLRFETETAPQTLILP